MAKGDSGALASISSGQPELDKKLGGGIPLGSLTLLEGQSDSGKSVVSQQLIWGSLQAGLTVLLFTTENTTKSFLRQMSSLNLEIMDFLLLGRLRVYPITVGRSKLTPAQVFNTVVKTVKNGPRVDLVIIDSLTTFVTRGSWEDTVAYFEECQALCSEARTIINVASTYAFDETTLARLRSMCDAHFTLRTEEVGDQLVKILEVAKVRGASKTTGNIITFDVEPDLGMKIIPISKASA
ncbi:MAG: ATPase domain-containing protein [Dehalococcoidia bacterium]